MAYAVNTVVEINDKRYIASKEDVLFSCQGCVFDNQDKSSECSKLNYYGEGCSGREGACSIIWKPLVKVHEKPVQTSDKKHKHYFKYVGNLEYIDVYSVLKLYEVTDPCIQHALKKLLVAGARGHKDIERDIQDVIDTLERWKELSEENSAKVPE